MRECTSCYRSFQDKLSHCPYDGSPLVRSSEPRSDHHLGLELGGKYRIESRLGEGGMCNIYRAASLPDGKVYAVKILHSYLSSDEVSVKRFKHEIYTASRINHPNVVSQIDSGETQDGIHYMVMELLEGTTLKQAIHQQGPFELARINHIVRQISDALDAAHAQGIIHRDLKPDNIMLVTQTDEEFDKVKVLDFGIAKVNTGDLSGSGERSGDRSSDRIGDRDRLMSPIVMGTPRYMSPEQCLGHTLDARSDIYSLGLIVYEMIAGVPPFTDSSARVLMNKHTQEPVPGLKSFRPDLPGMVERAVLRALEKSPLKRPQTAREFAEEINIAVHSDPSISSEQQQPVVKSNLIPVVKQVSGPVSIVEYVTDQEKADRQKRPNKLLSTSGQIKTHFKKRWTHWIIGLIIFLLVIIAILLGLLITSDPHRN
jgi:eukaryotic-like serine/threonine-protein kinase